MKEQVITYKTAVLANLTLDTKQDWFDKEETTTTSLDYEKKGDVDSLSTHYTPTQSLLQKWLREEHNILVIPDYDVNKMGYFHWIISDGKTRSASEPVDKWEDAFEEGLQEALKLI